MRATGVYFRKYFGNPSHYRVAFPARAQTGAASVRECELHVAIRDAQS